MATTSLTVDKVATIDCRGHEVAATVDAVQRKLTELGLPPDEQAREWLKAGRSFPEPEWMMQCVERAEMMMRLKQREDAVLQALDSCAQATQTAGHDEVLAGELAERQFSWHGAERGVKVDVLRDGIRDLAGRGFISRDIEQQVALRRALGVAVNEAERNSRGQWVVWQAEQDTLNYFIDGLWRMRLIGCPGDRRYRWQTLCGAFLRADGRRIDRSIKNNVCRNPVKREAIDNAILSGLAFVTRGER